MEFTYTEYQNTKKLILDEFQRCQDYYNNQKNDTLFDINQYKKLMDQVKTKKSLTFSKLNKMKVQHLTHSYSKTTMLNYSRITNNSRNFSANGSQKKINDSQFFLTNLFPGMNKSTNKQQPLLKAHQKLKQLQKIRLSTECGQQEESQIKSISNQIFHHQCCKKNLQKQIKELQNAITYMKKKFNYMQKDDFTFKLRKTEVQDIYHQNKISLNNFKRKNLNSANNFLKTSRAFQLNLQGRKKNQTQTNRKNQNTLDDATQKLIKIDKFRTKIKKQSQQIKSLDKENKQLIQNSKSFHLLLNHYKQVLIISDIINQLKNKQFVNIYQKLDLYKDISDEQFKQKTLKSDLQKITNTILKFFLKKKDQQLKLYSSYVIKSDQKKQLSQILSKLLNFQNYTQEQRLESFLEDGYIIQNNINSFQQELHVKLIDKKVKHLADNLVSLEDRMKFFIKRQYKSLKVIQQIWLKFDKSAANFVQEIQRQLISKFQNTSQSLSQAQSRNCFANYFQKWEKYSFFLKIINKNPFIYRFLNKQLLAEYLRKIVKTKMKQPQLETQKIFLSCLDEIQTDALNLCRENIIQLISIQEKINKYASKFQVLIVNSKNQDEQKGQNQKQKQIITIKSLKHVQNDKLKDQTLNVLGVTQCGQKRINDIYQITKNNYKMKKIMSNKDFNKNNNLDDSIHNDLYDALLKQWNKVEKVQTK